MNDFYRLVHEASQSPEVFTFPATIRAKTIMLEQARVALYRPRFNTPRDIYTRPPPSFRLFTPLEGDYMVIARELWGQRRADFQMPPDTGGASSSGAPQAPQAQAQAPKAQAQAQAPQAPPKAPP